MSRPEHRDGRLSAGGDGADGGWMEGRGVVMEEALQLSHEETRLMGKS